MVRQRLSTGLLVIAVAGLGLGMVAQAETHRRREAALRAELAHADARGAQLAALATREHRMRTEAEDQLQFLQDTTLRHQTRPGE